MILLTGGNGYIGSHTAVELLNAGFEVVIADNLSNSEITVKNRIEEIAGKHVSFEQVDVANKDKIDSVFAKYDIDAVVHFAGFKAVGESVEKPLMYYRNNLDTTISILEAMKRHGTKKFIFSSSATVYGEDNEVPFVETMKRGTCTNAYAKTKVMIEEILEDVANADKSMSVVLLRYFNPIGAHESGLIGEKPNGIPNNLMPYITQTAKGIRKCLTVFGADYDTPDGTCLRDYIHVVDLAKGHLAALEYANNHKGVEIFNLGTGIGYSVLEVIDAFEQANGVKINKTIGERRPGDIARCYADASKAERLMGWKATKNLEDMCKDSYNWEMKQNL